MHITRVLLSQRQPLIKFLGKRTPPTKIDHTPAAHPASSSSLPNTFATYRQQAQQHGPLNTTLGSSVGDSSRGSRQHHGALGVGRLTGASLGPVEAERGEYFDRSELGKEFQKLPWTAAEIEAIESGGASMFS